MWLGTAAVEVRSEHTCAAANTKGQSSCRLHFLRRVPSAFRASFLQSVIRTCGRSSAIDAPGRVRRPRQRQDLRGVAADHGGLEPQQGGADLAEANRSSRVNMCSRCVPRTTVGWSHSSAAQIWSWEPAAGLQQQVWPQQSPCSVRHSTRVRLRARFCRS